MISQAVSLRDRRGWLVASLSAIVASCSPPVHVRGSCDGPCPLSKIDHIVIIVQENHTFDNYFGAYCKAAPYSNPTCNEGPSCCEAAPTQDPAGNAPTTLDDAANGQYSPNHNQDCELDEVDGGKMDRYVTSTLCGNARNFAYVDPSLVQPYWQLAQGNALGDRFFQPLAGASSANDMYLARSEFVFLDDTVVPDALGKQCFFANSTTQYKEFSGQTLGDLLVTAHVSWAWYGEGYQAMVAARASGQCPEPPKDCRGSLGVYPCVYDPSDNPFNYYPQFRDNPTYLKDFGAFARDLAAGTLPQVSFIKAVGYKSEHPSLGTTISAGVSFVTSVVQAVERSAYQGDTLILFLYDEGGGYFDHVTPPKESPVDQEPYGTRIPFLAIGPFARKNYVSHVVLEHSSIVKFIEWNWLGGMTGQLGRRDTAVNNLGSLLDPAATGTAVPE